MAISFETAEAALRPHLSPTQAASWRLFVRESTHPQRSRGESPHLPEDPETISSVCDALRLKPRKDGSPYYREATIRRHIWIWRKCYGILREQGVIPGDPFSKGLTARPVSKPRLTQEEVKKLCAFVHAQDDRRREVYLELLAFAGLRHKEALDLTWGDALHPSGILVRGVRGQIPCIHPRPPWLMAHLLALRDSAARREPQDPVLQAKDGRPMSLPYAHARLLAPLRKVVGSFSVAALRRSILVRLFEEDLRDLREGQQGTKED